MSGASLGICVAGVKDWNGLFSIDLAIGGHSRSMIPSIGVPKEVLDGTVENPGKSGRSRLALSGTPSIGVESAH